MTENKIREVLDGYRKKFVELGIPKKRSSHNLTPKQTNDFLAHCHAMLDEIETLLKQKRLEKAFRWLGFIQGCLWTNGIYTVADLKQHNRP